MDARGATGGPTVVCTIIAKNYLALARTLIRSVLEFHPTIIPIVLLVDTVDGGFDPGREPFRTILAADLSIPRWPHVAMKYDVMELCTAVKPYLLEMLFDRFQADRVIYFDPDIVVYRRLDAILTLLDEHTVVLTPHLLDPLEDDYLPGELDILRAGSFNLGFIALSRRGRWRELLRWWQRRLYTQCTREPDKGIFVDQRWADLIPGLLDGVHVLRDPGCNVAYWNFKTRDVRRGPDGEGYRVDGQPLTFFHYSGFSYEQMEIVSRHQNRFTLPQLNENYRALFADYRERLRANGHETARSLPYAYGRFEDGAAVSDALRILLRTRDPEGRRWPDPYDIRSPGNFRSWSREPEPVRGGRLSQTLRYYRRFPKGSRRFLPPAPVVYTGPEGFYGGVRRALMGLGVLNLTRRMVGLRLIMTTRFFFQYQSPSVPAGIFRDGSQEVLEDPGVPDPARADAALLGVTLPLTAPGDAALVSAALPNGAVSGPTPPPEGAGRHDRAGGQGGGGTRVPGVNVIGFLHSETGIGQIARNLMESLEAIRFPVAALSVDALDPARQQDRAADRFPQGAPHPVNLFQVNADMTDAVRALLAPELYSGRYNIGYWAWELDCFPDAWQRCFATYDEIWVFSSFVQQAIARSSPLPVIRMPVSCAVEVPAGGGRAALGLLEDAFLVLCMFDARSGIERKNPWGAIRAFAEAFGPAERQRRARLVVKAHNLAAYALEAARLRDELSQVNGILIEDYLSRRETYELLGACDTYLSLHRSEGFGLALAEAMAIGKPVIGTGYSGNTDFMSVNTGYLIPFELVTLTRDHPPYRAGNVWAEPDVKEAARALRELYETPEIGRQKGAAAARYMRLHHHPAVVGAATAARLRYVLKRLRG